MKKRNHFLTLLPVLFVLLLSGCYFDIDNDRTGPAIRGSGNLSAEERMLPGFDRVLAEGPLDVIISQGSEQYVEVEADDNLLPYIRTSVRGGQLKISTTRSFRTRNTVTVYITLTALEALEVRGSGNIFGETALSGDQLMLEINGSGDVDMELYYNQIESYTNGSGNFRLSGETVDQYIRINGSGDYRAANLLSLNTEVDIRGSGNCIVSVSDYLRADIRGSGDIMYYGDPDVEGSVHGSGDLIQR